MELNPSEGQHNLRRPGEGAMHPTQESYYNEFSSRNFRRKNWRSPWLSNQMRPDWLLVSRRLASRSYVRGRKPARNDQRSVYRSLGFITVKFVPQQDSEARKRLRLRAVMHPVWLTCVVIISAPQGELVLLKPEGPRE